MKYFHVTAITVDIGENTPGEVCRRLGAHSNKFLILASLVDSRPPLVRSIVCLLATGQLLGTYDGLSVAFVTTPPSPEPLLGIG